MPFTFSHAALALPLNRLLGRRLPLSALVIGTLMPDLPYFVLGRPEGGLLSHTPAGLLLFCVPVGLAMFVLFHAVLRRPALDLLPLPWRERLAMLPPPRLGRGATYGVAAAGLLVGAASHLAWDSFTHPDGAAVASLPILQERVATVGGRAIPAYALLQWLSSLIGLAIVAVMVSLWFGRAVPTPAGRPLLSTRLRRLVSGSILTVSGAAGAAAGCQAVLHEAVRYAPVHVFLVRFMVVGPAAAALLLTHYAGAHRLAERGAQRCLPGRSGTDAGG